MSGEIEIMDDNDWNRIEKIVKGAIKPLDKRMGEFNARMDNLPCSDHAASIITFEAQRAAEKEQKKEGANSRDWILRIAVAALGLLVFLDKIGVFRALAR